MKFHKIIKSDLSSADNQYKSIEKDFKDLRDALHALQSKTFDVYQTSVTTDNQELVKQAKETWELAKDCSWDKIGKLHEAILKIIYK